MAGHRPVPDLVRQLREDALGDPVAHCGVGDLGRDRLDEDVDKMSALGRRLG